MLPTPVQIRDVLLKELDDKNEVDEPRVMEVVSTLEKYPITRATLEETRIGKMVNDLRRKIKNEKLAKRLKQLIRNWQNVLKDDAPVNGSPALSKLHLSPAVSLSPAPVRSALGVSSLATPTQQRSKPNTPVLTAQQSVPRASQGKKSAAAGQKTLSPATQIGFSSSPKPRGVASPALVSSRSRSTLTPTTSRVASPLVSGAVPSSSAMPDSLHRAAVNDRVASPALDSRKSRLSPLVSKASVQSPLSSKHRGSGTSSKQVSGRTISKFRLKGEKGADTDGSNLPSPLSPASVLSENSRDRLIGGNDAGRLDSDDESSSSSFRTSQSRYNFPPSHSTDMLTNTNNRNSVKDQTELSKANVASRKRARNNSTSPQESHKKSRTDSPNLSLTGYKPEKVVNGHKKSKKGLSGNDKSYISSDISVDKRVSSPLLSHQSGASVSSPQLQSSGSKFADQSVDFPFRDKPKVKTTEQLIQDLQKKNSSSNVGTNIMTKLRNNLIERESDVPESVLPAGMKSRNSKRGKNLSVPSPDVKFSKNELVERFLKSSDPSPSMDEYSPFQDDMLPHPSGSLDSRFELGECSNSFSRDRIECNFSATRQDHSESAPKGGSSKMTAIPSTSQSLHSRLSPTLQEMLARLPPVDDDIDWDSVGVYEIPEKVPVTDELVDRLHSSRLPGINGMYDASGEWTKWQQTMTLSSYDGDSLHILPYVDLDK